MGTDFTEPSIEMLLADERLLIGALITGGRKDARTCRRAIDLFGAEHDIALIVVRGRISTTGAATAGVDLRRLRHDIDMSNRCRARELCAAEGHQGRCTVAMVDRASPGSCVRAAREMRCDVLLVPGGLIPLRRRAFTRAARREDLRLVAVA